MTVPPPIKVRIWGLGAVPIYFVKWEKLQAAVADNVLTMPELNALVAAGEGVVGLATFYSSELHPSGGTAVPHFDVSAHGRLSNGKRFQFQVAGGDLTALIKHIKIVFE